MKKKFLVFIVSLALAMAFGFTACGSAEEEPAAEPEETTEEAVAVDATAYGYGGDDPVVAAVYKYMAEEVSKDYDPADASIPTVQIINVDSSSEDEIVVYGDFWIENYNIEGDTLKCASGGNYPGVMHLSKDYVVTSFDQVEDGANYDPSARELFGDYYEEFVKVNGDSDTREEVRKATVTDYVHFNGLEVTQYQDEGWDPVQIGE